MTKYARQRPARMLKITLAYGLLHVLFPWCSLARIALQLENALKAPG